MCLTLLAVTNAFPEPDPIQPIGETINMPFQELMAYKETIRRFLCCRFLAYITRIVKKRLQCRLESNLLAVEQEQSQERMECAMYGANGLKFSYQDMSRVIEKKEQQLASVREYYSHNACPITTDNCIACIKGVKEALIY